MDGVQYELFAESKNSQQQQFKAASIYYQTQSVKTALNNDSSSAPPKQQEKQPQSETKNRQRVDTIDTHQSDKDSSTLTKDPHTVIDKYANLPFMPQKNEQSDRRDILLRSKEFNPLISFPLTGPSSAQENKTAEKASAKGKKQKLKPLKKSTLESYSRQSTGQPNNKPVKSFLTYGSTNSGSVNGGGGHYTANGRQHNSASAKK